MEQAGTDYSFIWGQMRDYINGLNKKKCRTLQLLETSHRMNACPC